MANSCSGDVLGEAAATTVDVVPAASGATTSFLELSGDDYGRRSTGDLYELVWGGVAAALSPPRAHDLPQVLPVVSTPSEHDMAAWLRTIVTDGQESTIYAGAGAGDDYGDVAAGLVAEEPSRQLTTEKREKKLPALTGIDFNCTDTTRMTARGARRANYAESHSQTEKRRRSKINQRLKTLQQLVPGCGETNQVSTLEQTIRYVKSLQQQVQAMAPAVDGYYGVMRPRVLCTGVAVPPRPVAAFAPGRGCVPGLLLARRPSACTDDTHDPAWDRAKKNCVLLS